MCPNATVVRLPDVAIDGPLSACIDCCECLLGTIMLLLTFEGVENSIRSNPFPN